ncbi:UNVERIFIED_CONTAM: putative mitochondrial protein [Sesamum calycinum]|uniref:Mitochondrial protein n=3 Tax=Sesamum TaxID=4181 RepID=A0AAW2KF25_9LAMI
MARSIVSGQIGRTRRFHLWKAPTPNGLSRCSHFLADPSCKKGFFSPFPHGTCTLSVIEEYLGLEGGPPFSRKSDQNSNTPRFTGKDRTMGTNLQGTFFGQIFQSFHNYSSLRPLLETTQMFQFAKFEKSKERRLATELGYGFPIGDPWITDGISPWPFASESVLPSQCPGIHPMHSFRSCTRLLRIGYTSFGAVHGTPTQSRQRKFKYKQLHP